MRSNPNLDIQAARLLSADWATSFEGKLITREVHFGGMGFNDGVVELSDGSVAVRFQRDRGDPFIDVSVVEHEEWQPLWLLLLYIDKSLTTASISLPAGEPVLRQAFDLHWNSIKRLVLSRESMKGYLSFVDAIRTPGSGLRGHETPE